MRDFSGLFGHIPEDVIIESKKEFEAKQQRKAQSHFQCRIPDWTGQGGMVSFWINDNGTFESDDSRFDNERIKEGIQAFARNW